MKKIMISVLLVLTCLCLGGCGLREQMVNTVMDTIALKAEESGATALTRQFVDGLLARNIDQVASAMAPKVSQQSIKYSVAELAPLLPEAGSSYTLTPTHLDIHNIDGQIRTTIQFQLVISGRTFLLETLQVSDFEGLCSVHIQEINPATDVAAPSDAPLLQTLIMLVTNLTLFAVIIWALVDALRRPLNRRWLWLLVIILGNLLLVFSAANGQIRLNYTLVLYLSTAQIAVGEGGFGLKAMLPLGAIVYLALRNKLQKPTSQKGFAEAFAPPVQEAPTTEDAPEPDED